MLYELVHYLESTGDDFGLMRKTHDNRSGADGGGRASCSLLVESESGHCAVLKGGNSIALLEAEYASEGWWEALCETGTEMSGFTELGESVRLPAGSYLFGDVNALEEEPSSDSSLVSPAACVSLEWEEALEAIAVELDVDAETRVVGFLLRPLPGEQTSPEVERP